MLTQILAFLRLFVCRWKKKTHVKQPQPQPPWPNPRNPRAKGDQEQAGVVAVVASECLPLLLLRLLRFHLRMYVLDIQ